MPPPGGSWPPGVRWSITIGSTAARIGSKASIESPVFCQAVPSCRALSAAP